MSVLVDGQLILAPSRAERLDAVALAAFATLLGIMFLLLLAADQARVVVAP